MTAIAITCIEQLDTVAQKVPVLKGRIFHVYSEDELIEKIKGLSFPCLALVYDGLIAPEGPGATGKVGASADLVVSLMLFFKQNTTASADPKHQAIEIMQTLRDALLTERSPTGHYWRFKAELAATGKTGLLAYVQRWSTPVQLTR